MGEGWEHINCFCAEKIIPASDSLGFHRVVRNSLQRIPISYSSLCRADGKGPGKVNTFLPSGKKAACGVRSALRLEAYVGILKPVLL